MFSRGLYPLYFIFILTACQSKDFAEYKDITIYRDEWGVPHIYSDTDEKVAYGLAWATCEDDFQTIQEQMLAIQGKLGLVKGKQGILADMGISFMGIREYAKNHYREELSPKVIRIIEQYTEGINTFAKAHPEEVLSPLAFPVQPYDLITGYLLGLAEISGASEDLRSILNGDLEAHASGNETTGSNGIAIRNSRTKENQTFLAINSHQPLEGWYSWYEAHLISEEGTNILGGTFPGGATIFHGVNEYLGWAHTVNEADFSDIYKLHMHDARKEYYKVDGTWKKLEKKIIWAWMKLWGPFEIPVPQVIYNSDFGITFRNGDNFYAWRFVAGQAVQSIEQWYRMNKAKSFSEFKSAISLLGIPCTNIVYADKDHNVYYISNARLPKRTIGYDWSGVLPGDTSATKWPDEYWSVDSLPQLMNPASGIIYNTNNTPFSSSTQGHNPAFQKRYTAMGFPPPEWQNNRARRFLELISEVDSISYQDFKRIKYDRQYPTNLTQPHMVNQELILNLKPDVYPDIGDAIKLLNAWNRRTDPDNLTAALFIFSRAFLNQIVQEDQSGKSEPKVTEEQCAKAIRMASDMMRTKYSGLSIPLGEIQRHQRGKVSLPLGGGPDVLAAIYTSPMADGRYRASSGESYILLAKFDTRGQVHLESVNAFGTSANPESPHYTDQMNLYVNQQLKPMTLSLDSVKSRAIRSYHPMTLSESW